MTREFLLHLFEYDRERGTLVWKNPPKQNTYLKDKPTKTTEKTGYKCVCIDDKSYKVHRLIWFIENGTWPKMIDHLNGIKTDNRFENLAPANSRKNQQNQSRHRAGKLVGTSLRKSTGRWRSIIKIDGKAIEMGSFATELEAHQRYLKALKDYNV